METFETNSPQETLELGRRLADRFAVGDCVALVGSLGAGKTALVRGVAVGLGLEDENLVSSPTYVLVQEYPARMTVFHVDLYRLSMPQAELSELGIDEMLVEGVVLIEWADRAGDALPRPRWEIRIQPTGLQSRRFELHRVD